MNIAATQYFANYGSFEIFISGCDGECGCECHNRELWDFGIGNHYKKIISKIDEKVKSFSELINEIWVTGGEPLLQDMNDLESFLKYLKSLNKPIMLFTRFELDEIPQNILLYCDKVKSGKFDVECLCDNHDSEGIKLLSRNQKIYIKGRDYL